MFNVYCFEFNSIMKIPIFWFKYNTYILYNIYIIYIFFRTLKQCGKAIIKYVDELMNLPTVISESSDKTQGVLINKYLTWKSFKYLYTGNSPRKSVISRTKHQRLQKY